MKDFIRSKECFISFAVALIPSVLFWLVYSYSLNTGIAAPSLKKGG